MRKKTGGRQKGTPNKTTKEVRSLFQGIIEENIPNINKWIQETAKDNPSKALDLLLRMSDYVVPKVNRIEVQPELDKGKLDIPITWWIQREEEEENT